MEESSIAGHRVSFGQKCAEWFAALVKQNKLTILPQKGLDEIREFLSGWATHTGPKTSLHHKWKRKYEILTIGGVEVLCEATKGPEKDVEQLRQICSQEGLFDVLYQAHVTELGHAGGKSVFRFLQEKYVNISRDWCVAFCQLCPACNLRDTRDADAKVHALRRHASVVKVVSYAIVVAMLVAQPARTCANSLLRSYSVVSYLSYLLVLNYRWIAR